MRTSRTILLSLLLLAALTASAPVAKDNPGDVDADSYDVSAQVSNASGVSTFTYTITRTTDEAKDLGHFIVSFDSCDDRSPTIDNIVSATVNGEYWMHEIVPTDGQSACGVNSTNFVKFDNLPEADEYVIEFTLDDIYAAMDSTGWLKSGGACVKKDMLAPGCRGYVRTSSMEADASLAGKLYTDINTYMRRFGFDYTEHPNCTGGYGGHMAGVHGSVVEDGVMAKPVFQFDIHIDPVIDGDRCSSGTVDRQRNEMKSITNNSTWAKVQGNWEEWQILEWKFKLPAGFQPTANFGHIHQLKAQDGPNNGAPTITVTPRSSSSGLNKRMQIIHSVDGRNTDKGAIVDNVPLAEFENEWVQVRQEARYTYDGHYAIKITRISDGKVLIDFKDDNIDMWREGSSYIRSKFGLYRSLAGGRLDRDPVGQSPLLKSESIWITDFRVYEKNTNPTPGVPH